MNNHEQLCRQLRQGSAVTADYRTARDGMAAQPDAPSAGGDQGAAPDAAAALGGWPPRRRRREKRTLGAAVALAVVAAAGVAERSAVAGRSRAWSSALGLDAGRHHARVVVDNEKYLVLVVMAVPVRRTDPLGDLE